MIELNEEQRRIIRRAGEKPVRFADPETKAEYVVVRAESYDRMLRAAEEVESSYEYDDSPWTDEERDRLAEEAGEMLDRYQP